MICHQRQTGCVLTSIQQGMLKCAIATIHTHTKKTRLIWNVVKCPISHASEPDYCHKNYDLKMVIKHVNYENTKRVTLY